MSALGNMLSKLEEVKLITNRGLGTEPPAAGGYGQFLDKNNYFNVIESHFARV